MVYLSQPQQTIASSVFRMHCGEVCRDTAQETRSAQTLLMQTERQADLHFLRYINKIQ